MLQLHSEELVEGIDVCDEDKLVQGEPVEDLLEPELEPAQPERVVKICAALEPQTRSDLLEFLRENKDIFACSHDDILGIYPSIISHRLAVDPDYL